MLLDKFPHKPAIFDGVCYCAYTTSRCSVISAASVKIGSPKALYIYEDNLDKVHAAERASKLGVTEEEWGAFLMFIGSTMLIRSRASLPPKDAVSIIGGYLYDCLGLEGLDYDLTIEKIQAMKDCFDLGL